ncbi:Hypothetical protein PP7435_CHR2-0617 [Komagataella phaffii CBS 7435]|uniref:Uncharacterized protein n=2 Tax=Komagataella phaffii TaxID=460519 RepID=C4R1D5_KOMPG|nr:Hypothetical protein PAS_chr2-1_0664 [Komagataella phaffii GS115]AOA61945.1 GQ67_00727T0 [Komagataella phaffii]CAH2448162.1 Hypothetical protein BQ9382_C2-3350 [Komagataella phaffii CBS 7435]AOA66936.1 GQ68_00662T0 [Komagataella phaffii GS115]CAY69309.1 Hypothetical protein PAS_chr2-1_0664 [Komagataella phaffii GS115]CCA38304.1 Hypothetical protein PP7435_CHR2-0617 [Komagataella phaffii CBS 7435]
MDAAMSTTNRRPLSQAEGASTINHSIPLPAQSSRTRTLEQRAFIDVRETPSQGYPPHSNSFHTMSMVASPYYDGSLRQPYVEPSTRTGSMTSTASRLFRRGHKTSKFDVETEKEGEVYVDSNDSVTFDDLQYLRDRGRYGTDGSAQLDTTPLIPTLSLRPKGPGGEQNNTQYRKQLTAHRKMAMYQASKDPLLQNRAMSLQPQGMNPQNQVYSQTPVGYPAPGSFNGSNLTDSRGISFQGPEPRSMSFQTGPYQQDPRYVSHQSSSYQQDPRSMSFQGGSYQQDPRSMSFQGSPYQQDPRSMSFQGGSYQQDPRSMSFKGPAGDPRMASFSGAHPSRPIYGRPPQSQQLPPRAYSLVNGGPSNMRPRPPFNSSDRLSNSSSDRISKTQGQPSQNSVEPSTLSTETAPPPRLRKLNAYDFDEEDDDNDDNDDNEDNNQEENEDGERENDIEERAGEAEDDLNEKHNEEQDSLPYEEKDAETKNEQPDNVFDYRPSSSVIDSSSSNKRSSLAGAPINHTHLRTVPLNTSTEQNLPISNVNRISRENPGRSQNNGFVLSGNSLISSLDTSPDRSKQVNTTNTRNSQQLYHMAQHNQTNDTNMTYFTASEFTSPVYRKSVVKEADSTIDVTSAGTNTEGNDSTVLPETPTKLNANKADLFSLRADTTENSVPRRRVPPPSSVSPTQKNERRKSISSSNSASGHPKGKALFSKLGFKNKKESNSPKFFSRFRFNRRSSKDSDTRFNNDDIFVDDPSYVGSGQGKPAVPNNNVGDFQQPRQFESDDRSLNPSHVSQSTNSPSFIQAKEDVLKTYNAPVVENEVRFGNEHKFNVFEPLADTKTSESDFNEQISDHKNELSPVTTNSSPTVNAKDPLKETLSHLSVNELSKYEFTSSQVGMIHANSDLLDELQIVSKELAESINREYGLPLDATEARVIEQSKYIADLSKKLNVERKKRFIAEEQVLAWEKGSNPSALGLSYKNQEHTNTIVEKDQLIEKYKTKLDEYEADLARSREKIKSLKEKNDEYATVIIPELENKIQVNERQNYDDALQRDLERLKLENDYLKETMDKLTTRKVFT